MLLKLSFPERGFPVSDLRGPVCLPHADTGCSDPAEMVGWKQTPRCCVRVGDEKHVGSEDWLPGLLEFKTVGCSSDYDITDGWDNWRVQEHECVFSSP